VRWNLPDLYHRKRISSVLSSRFEKRALHNQKKDAATDLEFGNYAERIMVSSILKGVRAARAWGSFAGKRIAWPVST